MSFKYSEIFSIYQYLKSFKEMSYVFFLFLMIYEFLKLQFSFDKY